MRPQKVEQALDALQAGELRRLPRDSFLETPIVQ